MIFYYYLHSNGQLMHLSQKSLDQKPDFLKLKFVQFHWEVDTNNRNSIMIMLLQAEALNVDKNRINALKKLYAITDKDLFNYIIKAELEFCEKDSLYFVHHVWYDDHNDIIIGNGDTLWDALVDLVKKDWKNSPNFRYEDGNFLC